MAYATGSEVVACNVVAVFAEIDEYVIVEGAVETACAAPRRVTRRHQARDLRSAEVHRREPGVEAAFVRDQLRHNAGIDRADGLTESRELLPTREADRRDIQQRTLFALSHCSSSPVSSPDLRARARIVEEGSRFNGGNIGDQQWSGCVVAYGATDGDALVTAMKGMAWESPRGPISIDPDTRDVVQDIYIREVEKVDGQLYNVEFETFKAVKDPGKAAKK